MSNPAQDAEKKFDVVDTITFSGVASTTKTIRTAYPNADVAAGRVHIASDPGLGNKVNLSAEVSFYSRPNMLGMNLLHRETVTLTYTTIKKAAAVGDTRLALRTVDGLSSGDLVSILDTSRELSRIDQVAGKELEDALLEAHAVNTGVVRVAELENFVLPTPATTAEVFMRVAFSTVQTLTLGVEFLLRKSGRT